MISQRKSFSDDIMKAFFSGSFLAERTFQDHVDLSDQDIAKKISRWRRETGLKSENLFRKRLGNDQLSEMQFQSLIAAKDQPSLKEDAGTWLKPFSQICDLAAKTTIDRRNWLIRFCDFPYVNGVWPFLAWADKEFRCHWLNLEKKYGMLPFATDRFTSKLVYDLGNKLTRAAAQTFTLELHIARLTDQLKGDNEKARYQHYLDNHLTELEKLVKIYAEYPVLARLMTTLTNNWIRNIVEAVDRFCGDQNEIRQVLNMETGCIRKLECGLSDSHKQGRNVMILTFEDESKLVYKPKPLGVTFHFQEMLQWLNEKGFSPQFRIQKILDKGEYGWEDFIVPDHCQAKEEVRRFYQRQGGYLALLYLLEATDFHFENVIASGEYPFLVDTETLFTPRVMQNQNRVSALVKAREHVSNTVLRTQMLPSLLGGENGKKATEIGGLGGEENQETPFDILQWEEVGTENMRAVRKPGMLSGGNNRPVLHGQRVDFRDYAEDLITGFKQAYDLFLQFRQELVHVVRKFQNDPIRCVLRPTYIYSLLLEGGNHPDFLRNGLDRNRLMDRLWAGLEGAPHLMKTIASELEDLLHGDIPYFHSKPGSIHLWDSRGKKIENFFAQAGLSIVLNRCRHLSLEDCEEQCSIIRASLGIGKEEHEIRVAGNSKEVRGPVKELSDREALVEKAVQIGNYLADKAIWGSEKKDVTWLGLQWMGMNLQWQYAALDIGLYNGLSGMAFFYAYLAQKTKSSKFMRLAKASLTGLLDMALNRKYALHPSAYMGHGSVLYTLHHLSHVFEDDSLLDLALEESRRLEKVLHEDRAYDLLSGVAGLIIVLLQLHEETHEKYLLDLAIQCGNHLAEHAEDLETGTGWRNQVSNIPVGGFSHGAAGIAWALAELFAKTGHKKYEQLVLKSLEFERSLFVPEEKNWKDLRVRPHTMSLISWCNGAPGIGMSRLLMKNKIDDAYMDEEVDICIKLTKERGFGHTHCLCHGDMGNLSFLLLAAEQKGDRDLEKFALQQAGAVLSNIKNINDWKCGAVAGVQLQGLMLGLAGIGYGLLQAACAKTLPSPLFLDPPVHLKK